VRFASGFQIYKIQASNDEQRLDPRIKEWLSNPLLLLVVGGAISGLLIPYITNQWQNHQKELEIKTDLVVRISGSVMSMIIAVQFAEMSGPSQQSQEEYNKIFREWEISSAIIGSQIRAYFPANNLGPDWDKLSKLGTDVYTLSGISVPDTRVKHVEKIKGYFSSSMDNVDFSQLVNSAEREKYLSQWFKLKDEIIKKKDTLVGGILESHISL
jgi:hypothetical protein